MTLPLFNAEYELANRLRDHGVQVFAGDTTPELRAARARQAIIEHGIAEVIVGRGPDNKPRNYAQAFEATYGEPLEPAKPRKARAA